MNPHNPPIPESGPTFSDMCAMLDGCLNGDIFKFGPLVGGILIFIEASYLKHITPRLRFYYSYDF